MRDSSKGDVEKLAKLASDLSPGKGIVTLVSCLLSPTPETVTGITLKRPKGHDGGEAR